MKKLTHTTLLSGLLILLIFACKSKTLEPDLSALYEVKTDEFIKAEIDGKPFDYRTVLKTDYEGALKTGVAPLMFECATCKNYMAMQFRTKDPSATTPYLWFINIEKATTNLLVDDNTPVFYIAFLLNEKNDETNSNFRNILSVRTAVNLDKSWEAPMGNMIVKITSNENGRVSGTFSGKSLDGKIIKNGSFSLRYKL